MFFLPAWIGFVDKSTELMFHLTHDKIITAKRRVDSNKKKILYRCFARMSFDTGVWLSIGDGRFRRRMSDFLACNVDEQGFATALARRLAQETAQGPYLQSPPPNSPVYMLK